MYRLVKHRGKFSLAFTHPERGRVRIATGTHDRGRAEAIARDIWRKLNQAPSDRIADLWAAYVKDREQTVTRTDRFKATWAALEPHFGHRMGNAVNQDDCRAYARARKRAGMSDSTVKTELEFLRACLRFKYGNMAPKLWLPPASKPRERHLTKEEARTLLDAIETPHVRLFVILALATGARMSAILDLTWARVDLRRATADFRPAGRNVTNKRRTVVKLNEQALVALREAAQGALTDNVIEYAGKPVKSVKKAIGRAGERTGIPVSPHVFRHTAAVWAAEAGRPMSEIAQFLGHTSMRITEQVYARYSPEFLKGVSDALTF